MNRTRIVLRAVLAIALAVMLLTISASAQSVRIRTPVTFTLNSTNACPNLPAGLTVYGSGENFTVFTTRTNKEGNIVIEQNSLTTGTATDSDGATYTFNYHGHTSMTVPPAGFPFSLRGTDHFNLVGDGQASQLQMHFVGTATVYSVNPFVATLSVINEHGTPFSCDPI
jgi:hypothetical protein